MGPVYDRYAVRHPSAYMHVKYNRPSVVIIPAKPIYTNCTTPLGYGESGTTEFAPRFNGPSHAAATPQHMGQWVVPPNQQAALMHRNDPMLVDGPGPPPSRHVPLPQYQSHAPPYQYVPPPVAAPPQRPACRFASHTSPVATMPQFDSSSTVSTSTVSNLPDTAHGNSAVDDALIGEDEKGLQENAIEQRMVNDTNNNNNGAKQADKPTKVTKKAKGSFCSPTRWTWTKEQKQLLEVCYMQTNHPGPERIDMIAKNIVHADMAKVRMWFYNRRRRDKMRRNSDSSTNSPHPTLSEPDEYREAVEHVMVQRVNAE